MFSGWMILGEDQLSGSFFEIINNQRAYTYADEFGLCWLEERQECPTTSYVLPGGPNYSTPASDGAPWYDPEDPDTAGFLGIIGIDIAGADNSTRNAKVTQALGGGGVVGPLYFGPRTLIVRALAIARDDCSLQAGLNWLRCQYQSSTDLCEGDTLTYFDCCPCECPDADSTGGPCWIHTYGEIPNGPIDCVPDWWPSTYAELRDGPSEEESEDWCAWIQTYRDLATDGPPNWGCCTDACVVPYLRQFRHVRIIEGPTVLTHRHEMHSSGAFAEIEFTVIAADPAEYTTTTTSLITASEADGAAYDDPPTPPPPIPGSDPFGLEPVIRRSDLIPPPVDPPLAPSSWLRETILLEEPENRARLGGSVHTFVVTALAESDEFRLGLWQGSELITGYYMPFVPSGAPITIDAMNRIVTTPDGFGGVRRIDAFVRDYDGRALRWDSTPQGDLTLTIDRKAGDPATVNITVLSANVGCP